MAGFRKAKPEQAFLRIACYGKAGSGKTFTSLLIAEGLAQLTGKRVAYVDTERGTDFYSQEVPERSVHPEAFDFDALYTKSVTEIVRECKSLKPDEHGVVVLDSMTHIWEACINSYNGKKTRAGTIPMHAWSKIKAPIKELMNWALNAPMHVILCGRLGQEYAEDEQTGELKAVGTKMKTEGEIPYEPAVLLKMESLRQEGGNSVICAFAEKDRSGVLAGRVIQWPNYENIAAPLLRVLGAEQAHMPSMDEAAAIDAENISADDEAKSSHSAELVRRFRAKFELAETADEVETISKSITPAVKAQMVPAHVTELREQFKKAHRRVASAGFDRDEVEAEGGFDPDKDADMVGAE